MPSSSGWRSCHDVAKQETTAFSSFSRNQIHFPWLTRYSATSPSIVTPSGKTLSAKTMFSASMNCETDKAWGSGISPTSYRIDTGPENRYHVGSTFHQRISMSDKSRPHDWPSPTEFIENARKHGVGLLGPQAKIDAYTGIAGFMSPAEVKAVVADAYTISGFGTPIYGGRTLAVGVLVSWETLCGQPAERPGRC